MGGVSIYKFSIHHVHICTRKKNKATVTEGNSTTPGIHGPQHKEGKYTHGTVRGLRALELGGRGPVLAHTQLQSHTSTVHGTRGHLNTWSR